MKTFLLLYLLLLAFKRSTEDDNGGRPVIKAENGALTFEPANGQNINIRTRGQNSKVYVNDIDLIKALQGNATTVGRHRGASSGDDSTLRFYITGPGGILDRLDHLEHRPVTSGDNISDTFLRHRVNSLSRQILSMQSQINEILFKNDCNLGPCKNGGTCQRLVNGYFCQCPTNWEGTNCDVDVNECRNFAGTDLGCQHGTCINHQGSYECLCAPGWFGMHCTRKLNDCSGGSSEMCGHGICIPVPSGTGFTCICDQGWTKNGTDPACTTDFNECESPSGSHCSVNPKVQCINLPGSFKCGVCPSGYEGDGYSCSDVDECAINNGGCSKSPRVACHNTIGSRICGTCPPGYLGDGTTCVWRGSCSFSNGGCHPSAKCLENLAISAQFTQCVCPTGMSGDGIGIGGCYIPSRNLNSTDCSGSPCGQHGQCHILEKGITCICAEGFTGSFCDLNKDFCAERPCQNGGVCTLDSTVSNGYRCECTAQFSGERCQNRVRTCGGVLDSQEGSIMYPLANTSSTYNHNSRCAWLIKTVPNKVINVTFTKFNLELSSSCSFDFLQIHDGRSSGSHLIGRFCGYNLPKGGNIISSTHFLYLWFHSDPTESREGFSLHWTSINPTCGGDVDASMHGAISSPGFPGNYPPNRDCSWHLTTNPGKRILLHFFRIGLEAHVNCSFDYLEFFDGAHSSDTLLARYCNTTQPAPLQSAGSEMLIHFHSDGYDSGEGFQMSYAPVAGVPGCGGVYTQERGEITSPSYNGRYLHNLLCDYKIQVPSNSKISLKILNFELEETMRCRLDYLAIYDGPSTDSNLIGKFCGANYPQNVVSSSNSIYMLFKTDDSVARGGFKISYETKCTETFNSDSGVIKSPGYPRSYPANTVCEYTINTSPGKAIQIYFQNFDMEGNSYYGCRYDKLEVRDGPNGNSTLLGQFCNGHRPQILTSTHNYMFLKFSSDYSVSGSGFLANFTTVDVSCGAIYTSQTGVISHPAEDGSRYHNGQTCTWIIIAPPGYNIRITWNRFDIEKITKSCLNDYLEISERQENGEIISYGKFCGSKPPPAITSISNELKFTFKSDDSVRLEGFSLVYSSSSSASSCGGNYPMTHGYVYSPGWPNKYRSYKDCVWTISVPTGQQILLNISTFDLELSHMCSEDYLEIRNGPTDSSPLIGKYCGTQIPKQAPSHGNALYLHFHSDSYINGRGFKIEWDGTTTGCGGTLASSSGVITSPNYPQPYSEDGECFWRIVVSVGSVVRISFTDIDLENTRGCHADYIEIYDGHDASSPVLGRYCNMDLRNTTIKSKSYQVFIKFRSDVSIGGKGFSLNYYTDCQTEVTGFSGAIESPAFPNENPTNLNCLWTVSVPKGNTINITFTHINLPQPFYRMYAMPRYNRNRPHYYISLPTINDRNPVIGSCRDYVQIKNKTDNDFNRSPKFCGHTLPDKIVSSGNAINIKFVTGPYSRSRGFRLEWVLNGCGGTIKKSFGMITPPSTRRGFEEPIECEWLIETPTGTAVQIYFSGLNMRESSDCTVDAIEIYNGLNALSPKIMTICHKQDHIYQAVSTSNFLFVRLMSNSGFAGLDFRSSFMATSSRCGGRYLGKAGIFTSPNYPKNYDPRMNCLWYIQVPRYHRIKLDFTDLDLYSGSRNSCEDSIKIFNGVDLKSNYTRKYCGNIRGPISSFISKSNIIAVQFSSGDDSAKGFKGNFSITCGAQIISNSEGILKNYPSVAMLTDQNCTWTIIAEKPEQKVSLTLTHMDLARADVVNTSRHCPSDFLNIFDGNDEQAPLRGEYCSRKVPPTIVSRGNALTLQLGSYLGNVTGKFSAHYSVLDTACGGKLSSEEGTITSPSYPETYSLSTDCEWFIKTSPGNRVSVIFEAFDLERSSNCNEDYVEVRETNGGGQLLGVYCGNEIPTNTTRAAAIYIKFHSDSSGTAPGFVAHYAFVHGNDIINQTSGDIGSPLFPNYFHGSGEFSWRITTNISSYIALVLTQLEIDVTGNICYNHLTVYDGYDETAPVLTRLCGLLNPNDKNIRTTSNMVYIKMSLDTSNARSLFFLHWMEAAKDSSEATKMSKSSCGSNSTIILGPYSFVDIKSPNFPDTYGDNLDCEWIYQTIPGRHLKIKFTTFQLEQSEDCFMDYVQIYSGISGTNDWHDISGQLCLPTVTANDSLDTTNLMKVIFHSDPYTARSGFRGSVSSLCGGIFTDSTGIIEVNPADKALSTVLTTCNWKVQVKPRRTIAVNFERFNVSSLDNSCRTNHVSLRNGHSKESPPLGPKSKYCGVTNIGVLETTSNTLYVSFSIRNPDFIDFQGFRLRYEEKSIDCGSSIRLDALERWKIVNTTDYPQPPLPLSECVWTFLGPPGEVLRLDFVERFILADQKDGKCVQEYVEVRDGASENSMLIGQYCGREEGVTLKTTGNAMYLRFVTLLLEPNDGFKANISIDICGGTLRNRGEISSPGYPKYPNLPVGTVCEWRLVGRPGSLLWINPLDLSLPESEQACDISVVVEDNLPSNKSKFIQRTFCPNSFDSYNLEPIKSFANEVVIKIHLGKPVPGYDTSRYKGFRFSFNSTTTYCGGTINLPIGFIQTPGYPTIMNARYCTWQIEVPDRTHRIRLEFLDLDIADTDWMVSIYNDLYYRSNLAVISNSQPLVSSRVYESSGNTMTVMLRAGTNLRRGFKARFTSFEPAICGGVAEGETGSINSPLTQANQSYYCNWRFNRDSELLTSTIFGNELEESSRLSSNITLYLDGNMTSSAASTTTICSVNKPMIRVLVGEIGYSYYYREFCKNESFSMRIPVSGIKVKAYKNLIDTLNFNIMWKVQHCGGTVKVDDDTNDILNLPTAQNDSLDCAWYVKKKAGSHLKIQLEGSFSLPCSHEYMKIYGSMSMYSSLLFEYCQGKVPQDPISINFRSFYIEYHSDLYTNATNLKMKTINENSNACGGALANYERVLVTPNYPKSYSNNQECVWDISTTLGNKVGLKFVDRFQVEFSDNCTKDYVSILDWKEDHFTELVKFCGRTLPDRINSTSNRMRVMFRSDDRNTGDGFKARWEPICGGEYSAKENEQFLYSPNYPDYYPRSVDCIYKINAPNQKVFIKFMSFSLESNYGTGCISDNLTVSAPESWESDEVYCGDDTPPSKSYSDFVRIRFMTDNSIQRTGFKIMYKLNTCGGKIKNHAIIKSSDTDGAYEDNQNCIWNITAPSNKNVVIRFAYFDLEQSDGCGMDFVAIFNGTKIDDNQRLGLLCGRLNKSFPIFKSSGSSMVVQFVSDYGLSYKGFEAEIYFSYGESIGCGGEIDMTDLVEKTVKSPLIGDAKVYEKYLDCHWIVKTAIDKIIKIQFTNFHVAPCSNRNQTALGISNCTCDRVQIRDGANPTSAVITTYCGHSTPPVVVSSSNRMLLMLYTDGDTESSGFEAKLTVAVTECGREHFTATRVVEHVKSPHFDEGFVPRGLHCTYNIEDNNDERVHIRIKSLDLAPVSTDTTRCTQDRLDISSLVLHRNTSVGRDLIVNGHSLFATYSSNYFQDMDKTQSVHTLCGEIQSVDVYAYSATLRLVTGAEDTGRTHRGFDIEISSAEDCMRNYTGLQGRIQSGFSHTQTDCYSIIEVPENYTISVYVLDVQSYSFDEKNYFEILDGASRNSSQLLRVGASDTTLTAFSSGRYITIHKHEQYYSSLHYDLNYVATDKGSGCGGRLNAALGMVTSPLYPNQYRSIRACEFELETLPDTNLVLRFQTFDLGASSTCQQVYVELVGRAGSVQRTYCGDDRPADFHSVDNYVKIVYHTTMNTGGPGWVAHFIGI